MTMLANRPHSAVVVIDVQVDVVAAAYERTISACRKHGKHVGIGGLSSRPDLVERFVQMGARYVSTGTDLAFLAEAAAARANQVREIKAS